jgi:hypothetical protein
MYDLAGEMKRIERELTAANERVRLLISERDTARGYADQKWNLRQEFHDLFGTDDIAEAVALVRGLQQRINRLEQENDAMRADLLLWGDNLRLQQRINRLEDAGDKLSDCADQIGWTSCESPQWIKKAENAVKEWHKSKEAKP